MTGKQQRRESPRSERGVVNVRVLLLAAGVIVAVGLAVFLIFNKHTPTKTNNKNTAKGVVLKNTCTAADLQLSQGTAGTTAAGATTVHAVIVNHSSQSCDILPEYPAVFMMDSTHIVIGGAAVPDSQYKLQSLVLPAGAQAHAVVTFPSPSQFSDPSECTAVGAYLQLYVPGAGRPLSAPWAEPSCRGFAVSAFQLGS